MTRVSVIVPTYNDLARLKICVESLREQNLPRNTYEIIIIDNASQDGTWEWLKNQTGVRGLQQDEPGSYAARNTGLKYALGQVIAFTDSDCKPTGDWLRSGLRMLESTGADLAGGKVAVYPVNKTQPSWFECYEMLFAFDQQANVRRKTSITANLFVRREVFDAVGRFRQDLRSGGDIEWTGRASNGGHRIVYAADAVVWHPARATWEEHRRKTRRVVHGQADSGTIPPLSSLRFWKESLPPARRALKALRSDAALLVKVKAVAVHVFLHLYGSLLRLRCMTSPTFKNTLDER